MSFFRNVHVGHIKRTTHRVRASMPRYLEEYKRGRTILELARAANFSPHLFARQLAEHVTAGASLPKKMLGDAMRDPLGVLGPAGVVSESYRDAELVRFEERRTDPAASHVTRLAFEVKEAQDSDPLHGPEKEMKSHLVGVEFEVVLEHQLRLIGESAVGSAREMKMSLTARLLACLFGSSGIPFETEADLRDRGTARTPDVLLSCPLGIQVSKKDGSGVAWKMIGWIDSKVEYGRQIGMARHFVLRISHVSPLPRP
jgi:AraC-like DNA-binding protein